MESSARASSKAISQVQPTNTTSTNAQQDQQEQALPPAAPELQEEGVLPTININEGKRENIKAHNVVRKHATKRGVEMAFQNVLRQLDEKSSSMSSANESVSVASNPPFRHVPIGVGNTATLPCFKYHAKNRYNASTIVDLIDGDEEWQEMVDKYALCLSVYGINAVKKY